MGKRFWLVWLKRTSANLLVSGALAVTFEYFIQDDRGGDMLTVALLGMGLYLFASFALGLIHLLGGVVYFKLLMGDDFQAAVLEGLRAGKIPPPESWHPKTIDYLSILSDEPDAEISDRVKAAALYGALIAERKGMGFIGSIAHIVAVDSAILRYSQEAPRKKSS